MAVENKRMQQRYGTYSQFQNGKVNLLPNEFASVTADDPNTTSGKALYFNTESGEPNRLLTDEDKSAIDANINQIVQNVSAIINDMLSYGSEEIHTSRFAGKPYYSWVKLGFKAVGEQHVGGVCLMVIDSPVCTGIDTTLSVPLPFPPAQAMKIPVVVGNQTVLYDIDAGVNSFDIPGIQTNDTVSAVFAYRIRVG